MSSLTIPSQYNFILERAKSMPRRLRVAIAGSDTENILRGAIAAYEDGFVEPILIGNFKKTNKAYAKVDLLILDEWLIRCLSHQESYDLLEIIESRSKHGSTIFCTQYETDGWYARINAEPDQDSPIADAIMDRIINNSYIVSIEGRISMRERHGIKSDKDGKAGDPA